ncbi:electron transport complex subunit RsxC [Vibrio sp. 99-70-13A1]|uniref:electron transport complex subunit RsxC n=1 Tax=Vibrio sp. 99-70-13A1 TaxID=2607601 RepID=UPI00149356B7|nr:electron transport complex subunit RsxC [Vibrio sp. 99-70-13A1]NOH95416.1 electron transport complex subunit RsxC [Vibrio sp. 99-70-13A1]
MISLIEQIRTGSLWSFPGGVHPAENKTQSNSSELVHARIPSEIVLPVKQHIGKAGNLLVAAGDTVKKGQPLTSLDSGFTLPVHAPTSGHIIAIEQRVTAHPSGLTELSVIIKPDGLDTWCDKKPVDDFTSKTSDQLLDTIREAGISGMGGAGFPTAKKIQSGLGRTDILIVNAAECEPYITSDDKLLQEHADEILQGIEIVEHILKPKLTVIGIEDNKPKAIKALEKAAINKDIVIRVIPTKYPSGGEKQLIKILTNKEVPAGGIPADIGVLVQNVSSLFSIKKAVIDGEPVINRVVTLTGKTFKQPRNVWALLGTPVHELLEEFDYKADKKLPRLILGGPMMGFTLPSSSVPITKTSNCILAPTRKEISPNQYEMECIRCGQCAEACPASLLPQQLQWHAKANEYDKCEELNLKDCIECGACAYVCPSEIPLVQYYRQAKAEIKNRKDEAVSAERAKVRFEEKNARMERDKAERENRFKKAADNRRKDLKTSDGDDAIAAAIARVKAQESNADSDKPAVKPAVAAAIARAKAKQAEAQSNNSDQPDNSEMAKLREERKKQARERKAKLNSESSEQNSSAKNNTAPDHNTSDKKSAVAEAIARAKAKKAQQAEASNNDSAMDSKSPDETTDTKKSAVAAAIARAKAKKAQQAEANNESSETSSVISEAPKQENETKVDPKKAAVAAAIARAKAKKAQQAEVNNEESMTSSVVSDAPEQETETKIDPKKAAVAAAIARAKAKKAQQAEANNEESTTSTVITDAPEQETETKVDPKKAAVAAAIARAKAKKAQQAEANNEESTTSTVVSDAPEQETETKVDPKKAAVAAAIARAKAKKAQQAEANNEESTTSTVVSDAPEQETEIKVDPKKAAVAAAIARAKAKKAQQAEANNEESTTSSVVSDVPEQETETEVDPKKAAVSAAIARAKAKKAQIAKDKKNNEETE